jgi:hypothetical protein
LRTHGSFYLFQAHNLAASRRLSRFWCRRWCRRLSLGWANAPDTLVDIEVGNGVGCAILFVPGTGRLTRLLSRIISVLFSRRMGNVILRRVASGSRLLTVEAQMLFLDGIGDLGSLAKKVEILANLARGRRFGASTAKGVIVESIIGVVELVTEAVVSILEVEGVVLILAREASKWIVGL